MRIDVPVNIYNSEQYNMGKWFTIMNSISGKRFWI